MISSSSIPEDRRQRSSWLAQSMEIIGWTNTSLAKQFNFSRQYVAQVLNGSRDPTPEILRYVAQVRRAVEAIRQVGRLDETAVVVNGPDNAEGNHFVLKDMKRQMVSLSVSGEDARAIIRIQDAQRAVEIGLSETDRKLLALALLSLA